MPFCYAKEIYLFWDRQCMCLSLYYSHSVMQKLLYCIDKQLFVKILTNDGNIYILIRI